jgi:hypothetical protein
LLAYHHPELVEVFAINTMAPFILNKRAIPLLDKVRARNNNKRLDHTVWSLTTLVS